MELRLDDFFNKNGYLMIPSNLPELKIYYRMERNYVIAINIVDNRHSMYFMKDQYDHLIVKIRQLFEEQGITQAHILSILIDNDIQKFKKIADSDDFCWMIDSEKASLVLFEHKVPDFYGLKGKLEEWLINLPSLEKERRESQKQVKKERRWASPATISLIVINIIIFLTLYVPGNNIYKAGIQSSEDILLKGQYYRLITSMFLHSDLDHIFNNMLLLFFVGEIVESKLGRIRFLVLYFLSGVAGGLLSLGTTYLEGIHSSSLGASGAVFGIVGALLGLVLLNHGKLQTITTGRMVIMIFLSLYNGFAAEGIDNAAHIGGLVFGFLLTFFLDWTWIKKMKRRHQNES